MIRRPGLPPALDALVRSRGFAQLVRFAVAAWFVVAGSLRAAARLGGTVRDTLLYAGELVVGR